MTKTKPTYDLDKWQGVIRELKEKTTDTWNRISELEKEAHELGDQATSLTGTIVEDYILKLLPEIIQCYERSYVWETDLTVTVYILEPRIGPETIRNTLEVLVEHGKLIRSKPGTIPYDKDRSAYEMPEEETKEKPKQEKMTTDKKTLDDYFTRRKLLANHVKKLKDMLRYADEAECSYNHIIHSAASEYIFAILADPNNQERYGRQILTYKEIQERVVEEEPRFTESDIKHGLDDLLSEIPPRIEERTKTHTTAKYIPVAITTYGLREQND